MNIAIANCKMNKNQDALIALNKAIKYNPKYVKALVKRGEVNIVLENFKEAVRDFSEASEHDPTGFNV